MSVRAIIFDIGNVLIEWQPEAFFDRVIGAEKRAAFFEAVPFHNLTDRIDRGEVFEYIIAEAKAAYPEWAEEIAIWGERWIEMAAPAIDHSVRLLRALRRSDHQVFALSNFGNETLRIAEQHYPFLEEFDRRYISGEMSLIKPEAEIYAMVEADCGLPPDVLLFTDDRLENIEAAQTRGWQTHLFDGAEGLAARLVAEGLLIAEDAK